MEDVMVQELVAEKAVAKAELKEKMGTLRYLRSLREQVVEKAAAGGTWPLASSRTGGWILLLVKHMIATILGMGRAWHGLGHVQGEQLFDFEYFSIRVHWSLKVHISQGRGIAAPCASSS